MTIRGGAKPTAGIDQESRKPEKSWQKNEGRKIGLG
jgi:hypothetical protein